MDSQASFRISYCGITYEITLHEMPDRSAMRHEIMAGIHRAMISFHEDYAHMNKRIFKIKALINEHLAELNGVMPDKLLEALKE